jgi:hypothetical protein
VATATALVLSAALAGSWGGPMATATAHPGSTYRWAEPPAGERSAGPPVGTSVRFEAGADGSLSQLVATPDGQLLATFPAGAFGDAPRLVVRARDAAALGPPPAGTSFDSNAYELAADGDVDVRLPFRVALRFAHAGTTVVELDDGTWRPLPSSPSPAAQQVRAEPAVLGTFAVVGDASALANPTTTATGGAAAAGTAVIVGLVALPVVAVAALVLVARRRRRRA